MVCNGLCVYLGPMNKKRVDVHLKMATPTRAKGVASENLFQDFFFPGGGSKRRGRQRSLRGRHTWESWPSPMKGGQDPNEAGVWVFLQVPSFPEPCLHFACWCFLNRRLLGITARPSETINPYSGSLEWLPEFRGFLPKSCYLLESSHMVSSLLFGNRIQH